MGLKLELSLEEVSSLRLLLRENLDNNLDRIKVEVIDYLVDNSEEYRKELEKEFN